MLQFCLLLWSMNFLSLIGQAVPVQTPANGTLFNVTALTTAADGNSALECWQLANPFFISTGAGTVGAAVLQMANVTNVTYSVLPPMFEGGLHVAPFKQLVVFVSGLAHVTLPSRPESAWIKGGTDRSLLIAADTAGTGHISTYPSYESTIALQIPFLDGQTPPHNVLGTGPCP